MFPGQQPGAGDLDPQQERARANANSVCTAGMYSGNAFLSPVLFWITATWGWRALFIIAGVVGLLFAGVWYLRYRGPQESPMAVTWLLSKRQILGASIGRFATNATLVFFLTWFPAYLVTERSMP